MPRSGWNTRQIHQALTHVIARDGGTCWLCGHPGANSIDHVIPVIQRPDLEWTSTNWKGAHLTKAGTPTGCTTDGCTCVGNKGRRDRVHNAPPSRTW